MYLKDRWGFSCLSSHQEQETELTWSFFTPFSSSPCAVRSGSMALVTDVMAVAKPPPRDPSLLNGNHAMGLFLAGKHLGSVISLLFLHLLRIS